MSLRQLHDRKAEIDAQLRTATAWRRAELLRERASVKALLSAGGEALAQWSGE